MLGSTLVVLLIQLIWVVKVESVLEWVTGKLVLFILPEVFEKMKMFTGTCTQLCLLNSIQRHYFKIQGTSS